MSEYANECTKIALASAEALKNSGKAPTHIEFSADVHSFMNMGGINAEMDDTRVIGLLLRLRYDITKHIQAIAVDEEGVVHRSPISAASFPDSIIHKAP